LENVVQRYVVLGDEEAVINELTLSMKRETSPVRKGSTSSKKVWPSLREVHYEATIKAESEIIRKALERTN